MRFGKEEIDMKVNMLQLKEVLYKYKRKHCRLTCDCGGEKICRLDSFLAGRYFSCGCHHKVRPSVTASLNGAFKGVGDMRGFHFDNIKQSAKKRNKEFDLTKKYLWELYVRQNKKCALSGWDIQFGRIYFKYETTASLDRIDSSKGYIVGNVQWVHKLVNLMKNSISQKDFISICQSVSDYSKQYNQQVEDHI
jgi:hypothetical protein